MPLTSLSEKWAKKTGVGSMQSGPTLKPPNACKSLKLQISSSCICKSKHGTINHRAMGASLQNSLALTTKTKKRNRLVLGAKQGPKLKIL